MFTPSHMYTNAPTVNVSFGQMDSLEYRKLWIVSQTTGEYDTLPAKPPGVTVGTVKDRRVVAVPCWRCLADVAHRRPTLAPIPTRTRAGLTHRTVLFSRIWPCWSWVMIVSPLEAFFRAFLIAFPCVLCLEIGEPFFSTRHRLEPAPTGTML